MAVDFNLYLITDRKVAKAPLAESVRLALNGGVRAVQLREKDMPVREYLLLAQELRILTKTFGAKLFINDRVDVAFAIEADGVHLGTRSMPPGAVRKVVGRNMLIGCSTHTIDEALEAERGGADFITFGPVFPTPSKMVYGPPVGIEALRTVTQRAGIPVFGIGGIKLDRISPVTQAGAAGIAMISAIFAADDVQHAAEDILQRLHMNRRGDERNK